MPSGARVFRRGHLDDAAQFAPVLGRVAGGAHVHRLNLIHVESRRVGGRAVVHHGKAVHHVLRVVLRAARVQHAVGLQQPTRLHLDQIEHCTPWHGGASVAQRFFPHVIRGRSAMRIEERGGIDDDN